MTPPEDLEATQEAANAPSTKAPPRDLGPITDAEFEAMVERGLERVPARFLEAVENCAFIVESETPPGQPGLLGLYHGVPATERRDYAGAMPDTITIYQSSIVRIYKTRERVEEQVHRTLVHEIGHYFGLEEDELHALGWG